MTTLERAVGAGLGRVEGTAKVTGAARYAAEYPREDLAHGWLVQATAARGRITAVDTAAALALPGVLGVLTHENAPRLGDSGDPELRLLQDDRLRHHGQIVALVVAATPEQARAAASAVRLAYAVEPHDVTLTGDGQEHVPPGDNPEAPRDRAVGDVEAALAGADVVLDRVYTTPAEHNNPMEPHAATASWDGDRLTVHDSNQGAASVRRTLAALFGLEPSAIRVLAEHVGGGFGAKGTARPPVVLAAMAARALGRPVRVVLTRQQMFDVTGYRSPTRQRLRLGATRDGRLLAIDHLVHSQTSTVRDFAEQAALVTHVMYAAPNIRTRHRLVRLDVPSPSWMRAPGEAPGSFALETAMDELAHAVGVDPVELRVRHDATREPLSGKEFSSRGLVACLRRGAELAGWGDRDPAPGVRRDGRWLAGTGVAASTYGVFASPSTATAHAGPDGSVTVRITAADIGTGARTVLIQVAADELGLPTDRVRVLIGDSDFGRAAIAGGSAGTASWSWAVVKACRGLRGHLADVPPAGVTVHADTREDIEALPDLARHSFGAQFAEVRVDPLTGEIRVPRLVGVFAAGRILNPVTARSQLTGGMIMGLSMALFEESVMDPEFGDYLNHDLAGYHVATNADVGTIDVEWVDERDDALNPLGVKGIGELGIVGTAAAIGNAVWHATGRRVRDLPLRPDRVLLS
ncbi:MAG TPA: xanthine dehydrogenase family protein molybdopterin-binding subunit [Pseudonocardiaceae bacterium]